jgi:hypothetical protein
MTFLISPVWLSACMIVTGRISGSKGAHKLPQVEFSVTVHDEEGYLVTVALHLLADLQRGGMLDCRRDDMPPVTSSPIAFGSGEVDGVRPCLPGFCEVGRS